MFLQIIIILILIITPILGIYNTIRMNNFKMHAQQISLMDLAEFENLSKDVKEFYKTFILEKWIKDFNNTLNNSLEVNGLSKYYVENKEKLTKLNNLYLDIAKISIKGDSLISDKHNVLIYNADLDKLILDAESRKAELSTTIVK